MIIGIFHNKKKKKKKENKSMEKRDGISDLLMQIWKKSADDIYVG